VLTVADGSIELDHFLLSNKAYRGEKKNAVDASQVSVVFRRWRGRPAAAGKLWFPAVN